MKRALYFDSLILAVGNLQKAACTAIRFRHILISMHHIKNNSLFVNHPIQKQPAHWKIPVQAAFLAFQYSADNHQFRVAAFVNQDGADALLPQFAEPCDFAVERHTHACARIAAA